MPPDLSVADQSVEARRGPSAVEKGIWVHGKQERQHLTIREAVKARLVVPWEGADVRLQQIILGDERHGFGNSLEKMFTFPVELSAAIL